MRPDALFWELNEPMPWQKPVVEFSLHGHGAMLSPIGAGGLGFVGSSSASYYVTGTVDQNFGVNDILAYSAFD